MYQNISLPQLSNVDLIPLYEGNFEEDCRKIKSIGRAKQIIGGLSQPSKMPCLSYNLPSSKCITGQKLKDVEGSVCYGCYAADDWKWVKRTHRYSNYPMPNVTKSLKKRYKAIHHPLWVPAMVMAIKSRRNKYFRFHDSGDIQSLNHLRNITQICQLLPRIKFWLPTREYHIVDHFLMEFDRPENLIIRISAHMLEQLPPKRFEHGSMVSKKKRVHGVFNCGAYKRGGRCGSCRSCWSDKVSIVSYPYH